MQTDLSQITRHETQVEASPGVKVSQSGWPGLLTIIIGGVLTIAWLGFLAWLVSVLFL